MNPKSRTRSETAEAWLYLAPAGVILLVFWFLPVLISLGVSFTNWEGADTLEIVRGVGLRNYRRTLGDIQFWLALVNTLHFAFFSVSITMILSLAAALLLHRQVRASAFFRTVFFLPYVSTWVAISIVWRYFFDVQAGPLNYILRNGFALEPLRWLQEPRGIFQMMLTSSFGLGSWFKDPLIAQLLGGPSLAMASVIVSSVWRDIGFFVVIFLAGLGNIDPANYEAARIDGAGPWDRFRHITLPLLSPTLFFLLVVALIGAFREFTPMLVMTPGGGPAKTTTTLIYYLYEKGFVQWKLGLASAVAYLLFILIFGLTWLQNRLLGRRVEYES